MVVADFNIFCLNQKKKKIFTDTLINIDSVEGKNISKFYGEKWTVLSAFNGYAYSIYPTNENKEYEYTKGFFDLKIKNGLKYVLLENLDKKRISKIIEFYLQQSPIKKICILIRLDWQNDNKIIGTINKDVFLLNLEREHILFNTAYIITN